jgi:hypothetical protein
VLNNTKQLQILRHLNSILKFHAEVYHLYFSPDMVQVISPRRMRWVLHVACIDEMRNAYRVLVGTPEGKIIPGCSDLGWELY